MKKKSPQGRVGLKAARREFALTRGPIHLDAMLVASTPRRVRKKVAEHRRGLDRDPHGYLRERVDGRPRIWRELARVGERALAYLGISDPDRISALLLTDSTTTGLGWMLSGISMLPGQEILTSDNEFFSGREALERARSHRIHASVSSSDHGRDHLRFSPSILNTAGEIDRTVAAIRTILKDRDRPFPTRERESSVGTS